MTITNLKKSFIDYVLPILLLVSSITVTSANAQTQVSDSIYEKTQVIPSKAFLEKDTKDAINLYEKTSSGKPLTSQEENRLMNFSFNILDLILNEINKESKFYKMPFEEYLQGEVFTKHVLGEVDFYLNKIKASLKAKNPKEEIKKLYSREMAFIVMLKIDAKAQSVGQSLDNEEFEKLDKKMKELMNLITKNWDINIE